MALLEMFERRASPENPRTNLANPASWLWDAFGASKSAAGVNVSERSAMQLSTVYACVRVIAESVASLPLFVYKRLDRGKRVASDHPLHRVLHDEANSEMPAFTLKELLQSHAVSYGNGFAEIETNGRGEVVGLWPLMPDVTRAERVNGRKIITTTLPDGEKVALPADRVLHIPGLGFDGLNGYSVIRMASQAIGLALATEEHGARLFGNGARPAGVLETPNKLGDTAIANLRKSWQDMHQGLSNAHRVAILEQGMKFNPITISNEDAQFLETRKFQVSEIARWFRVPPHMIGDLERATFSNIEHQSLEFVMHTLRPWLVRWEQCINRTLFTQSERKKYFAEFKIEALLRGDHAARAAFYKELFYLGAYSPNDIREKENENPIEGGDRYFMQQNLVPVDRLDEVLDRQKQPAKPPENDDEMGENEEESGENEQKSRVTTAFRGVLQHSLEQMFRRRANAIRNQLKKGDLQAFRIWYDDFIAKEAQRAAGMTTTGRQECAEYDNAIRDLLRAPETAASMIESYVDADSARARRWADSEIEHITQRKAA